MPRLGRFPKGGVMAISEERIDAAVGKVQVLRGGAGPDVEVCLFHSAMGEEPVLALLDELAATSGIDRRSSLVGAAEGDGRDRTNIEDFVFHILDVLDVLNLPSFLALVGTSFGGSMVRVSSGERHGPMSKLVLVNPAGLCPQGARRSRRSSGHDPADLARLAMSTPTSPHPVAYRAADDAGHGRPAGSRPSVLGAGGTAFAATAKIASDPYLHNPKLPKLLPRWRPALVARPTGDHLLIPHAHVEHFAGACSSGRVVDVAAAGHMLPLGAAVGAGCARRPARHGLRKPLLRFVVALEDGAEHAVVVEADQTIEVVARMLPSSCSTPYASCIAFTEANSPPSGDPRSGRSRARAARMVRGAACALPPPCWRRGVTSRSAAATASSSAIDSGASTNTASTPRSRAILARSHASSRSIAARGRRCAVTKLLAGFQHAAELGQPVRRRDRPACPALWPRFLGHSWSSRKCRASAGLLPQLDGSPAC